MTETIIPPISVSVMADPKMGKTHFACTFPEPICLFSFDLGADIVVKKFGDKKIVVQKYPIPLIDPDDTRDYALELYKRIKTDYAVACEGGEYQTVVLDTGTHLWEIIRHAYSEKKAKEGISSKPGRLDYTQPNAWMSWFLMQPMVSEINLVATHYLKDVYVQNEATGEKKLDGYARTNGIADIIISTRIESRIVEKAKKQVVVGKLEWNRFDIDLNGTDIVNPTYDEIAVLCGLI